MPTGNISARCFVPYGIVVNNFWSVKTRGRLTSWQTSCPSFRAVCNQSRRPPLNTNCTKSIVFVVCSCAQSDVFTKASRFADILPSAFPSITLSAADFASAIFVPGSTPGPSELPLLISSPVSWTSLSAAHNKTLRNPSLRRLTFRNHASYI